MSYSALNAQQQAALNGVGLSSPLALLAQGVRLGDRLKDLETARTGLATAAAQIAAAGAENTDVQVPLDINAGKADAGTYTYAITSAAVQTLTRSVATAAQSYWIPIPARLRTTASKGLKILGLKASYQTGTAACDDIRFEIWKRVMPADNAAPAAPAVVGGDQNAHYDAAHDTIAERVDITGAPEKHTLTMTLPAPAYMVDGEEWFVRVMVDGDAGPTGTFVLTDLRLLCSEAVVDLT